MSKKSVFYLKAYLKVLIDELMQLLTMAATFRENTMCENFF